MNCYRVCRCWGYFMFLVSHLRAAYHEDLSGSCTYLMTRSVRIIVFSHLSAAVLMMYWYTANVELPPYIGNYFNVLSVYSNLTNLFIFLHGIEPIYSANISRRYASILTAAKLRKYAAKSNVYLFSRRVMANSSWIRSFMVVIGFNYPTGQDYLEIPQAAVC